MVMVAVVVRETAHEAGAIADRRGEIHNGAKALSLDRATARR